MPSSTPTPAPTPEPTPYPTPYPSPYPTPRPTPHPTPSPTHSPTTPEPSHAPTTPSPSARPTFKPTPRPTPHPTFKPTPRPTPFPTFHPTPRPTPATNNCPYSLAFGTGRTEYELQFTNLQLPSGVYTISAFAKYTSDYDGQQIWTHARFFDRINGVIGKTAEYTPVAGAYPTQSGEWQHISETFDTGSRRVGRIFWYVGYPGDATSGSRFITQLQITTPDGTTLIPDGDFPNGADLANFVGSESQGLYGVVRDCSAAGLS